MKINRKQRRDTAKKYNFTDQQCKVFETLIEMAKIKKTLNDWKPIPEGTLVKLNIEKIKSHPDWDEQTDDYNKRKYVNWIIENTDQIFTVVYDKKRTKDPVVVCLKEDTTTPKWLFWEGNLTVLKN